MKARHNFGGMAPVQPLKDFDFLKKGYARRGRQAVRCFKPPEIDVAVVRAKSRLSKTQFAACFGIPAETLRHWERGDRKPRGASLVLLHVIDRDPRAVIRALGSRFQVPVPRYVRL